MDDLIVTKVAGNAFPGGNGRQVARRQDGVWFLACDEGSRIVLRTSQDSRPLTEAGFNEPIRLAGTPGETVLSGFRPGGADQVSMLVDSQDRLHLGWRHRETGELWYAQSDVNGPEYDVALRKPGHWWSADGRTAGPERVTEEGGRPASLGDLARDEKGRVFVAYHQGEEEKSVHVAVFDTVWRRVSFPVTWDSRDPTLDVEEDGTLHLVFGPGPDYQLADWSEDPFGVLARTGIYHTQSRDGGVTWTHADGKTPGVERIGISGDHPQVLASQGRIWVAFSAGGSWEPAQSRRFREGPTLHYSYYDGHQWQGNRYCCATDPDLSVSPRLFLDGYGQPRLYFVKLNRHHTYMCRWMGPGWSPPQESRWGDELSPGVTVEKRMPPDADAFGLLWMAAEPAGEVTFSRVETPRLQVEAGERILFLDLWELGAMSHLELRVNTAKKDPHNPILNPGEPGEWDEALAIAYGSILYEDGLYRMWYQGVNRQGTFGGVGYATSPDGVHWEKPKLGLFEYNGRKDNNICILSRVPSPPEELIRTGWSLASCTEPSVFKDEKEPDPQKRYKIMLHRWKHLGAMLVSPDGIHWTDWPSTPFQEPCNPGMEQAGSLFWDDREPDPKRRWKVYGQMGGHRRLYVNSRHGALAFSPDGRHWTVSPRPVLDPHGALEGNRPMRREDRSEANDHLLAVYPYRQYYLGIYDFWYESTALDNELAVSRDGYHFVRVANGQKLIPLGETGEWDAAIVSKAHTLVQVEDQILIYYAGMCFSCVETHPFDHFLTGATGLARVPADGWTYLRVSPERHQGQATTLPLDLRGKEGMDLVVKADHLQPGTDYILAELLDGATGPPIPGFSAAECAAIDQEGEAVRVQWQGGRLGEAERDSVRIRFHLYGDNTRLYCFGFEPV